MRLEESLCGNTPLENLGGRLEQLATLNREHNRSEEILLEKINYPHLWLHIIEHKRLEEECHSLLGIYGLEAAAPLIQLSGTLVEMFIHHIDVVDRDYVTYLPKDPTSPSMVDREF